MLNVSFDYRATITNVVDGDTLDVVVDLGFRITIEQRVRLYGINTPERGQPGYDRAKLALAAFVGRDAKLRTIKPNDKYGRWLAEVYVDDESLAVRLLDMGLGVPYFGGAR